MTLQVLFSQMKAHNVIYLRMRKQYVWPLVNARPIEKV